MRLSLTRLRQRAAEVADEAATGSAVPSGAEPAGEEARTRPTARERGAMRRRLRQLRRHREALLLELGALTWELHRRDRQEPELVERKLAELRSVDEQERGLAAALEAGTPLLEVVAAGITGTCASCGALLGTDARFCSRCGAAVSVKGAEKKAGGTAPAEGQGAEPDGGRG